MVACFGDGCGVLHFPSKSVMARLSLQGLLCLGLSRGASAATAACGHRFLFVFFRETDTVSHRVVHPELGRVGWSWLVGWSWPWICSAAILMDVMGGSVVGGMGGLFQMLSFCVV